MSKSLESNQTSLSILELRGKSVLGDFFGGFFKQPSYFCTFKWRLKVQYQYWIQMLNLSVYTNR